MFEENWMTASESLRLKFEEHSEKLLRKFVESLTKFEGRFEGSLRRVDTLTGGFSCSAMTSTRLK
jgi:site-specific DNA-cytosine methylase